MSITFFPDESGVSSANNTTTTPLSGGSTYTGAADRNSLPDVMVSCQTDADGTLYFDFSVDGTNWSTFPTAGFAVSAGIHEFHTAVKGPRDFRVRLVNGSGAQSYLRLYTYFGTFRQDTAKRSRPPIAFQLERRSISSSLSPCWPEHLVPLVLLKSICLPVVREALGS